MTEITREMAGKWLGDVPPDKQFWCRDGRVLKNVSELAVALTLMTDEAFHYHSNDTKSDFSRWIKDVVGDLELAEALHRNISRLEAAKILADRISGLNSHL